MKQTYWKILFLVFAAFALASCGGGSTQAEIGFRKLSLDPLLGPNVARTAVIQTDADWQQSMSSSNNNPTTPSGVNFQTETILFVSYGIDPSANYSMRIVSVVNSGGKLNVNVEQLKCATAHLAAVIYPVAAVAIEKTSEAAVFNIVEKAGCPSN